MNDNNDFDIHMYLNVDRIIDHLAGYLFRPHRIFVWSHHVQIVRIVISFGCNVFSFICTLDYTRGNSKLGIHGRIVFKVVCIVFDPIAFSMRPTFVYLVLHGSYRLSMAFQMQGFRPHRVEVWPDSFYSRQDRFSVRSKHIQIELQFWIIQRISDPRITAVPYLIWPHRFYIRPRRRYVRPQCVQIQWRQKQQCDFRFMNSDRIVFIFGRIAFRSGRCGASPGPAATH